RLLGEQGPRERGVAGLARVLSDPTPAVRRQAARALGRALLPEASRGLVNHLDDPQQDFQLEVIAALAVLREPLAVLPLVANVQDSRAIVRRAAIRALAGFGSAQSAVGPLVLALSDSDVQVRLAAVRALGSLKAHDAADALEDRL